MGKVKSLKLTSGTRIGSYRILAPLGRGWEGEVYAVEEVPTTAKRAMKLIARENVDSVRDVIHTAWFFEQLAPSNSVARYYHMGQWFLDDNEGLFFLVFAHLSGSILKDFVANEKNQRRLDDGAAIRLVQQVTAAIERVHHLGYAVGDFAEGTNLIISGDVEDPRPLFCDLDPGKADQPNVDYQNDAKELAALCDLVFHGLPDSAAQDQVRRAIRAASRQPPNRVTFAGLIETMRAV